jgi:hypothetical protein
VLGQDPARFPVDLGVPGHLGPEDLLDSEVEATNT